MSTSVTREQVSAALDGEWAEPQGVAAARLRAIAGDEQARADWLLYAQIGDLLRSADLQLRSADAAFVARVSAAIEQEPVVIAPAAARQIDAGREALAQVAAAHRRPHWSTRIAAGMAAVAGVAVMAWVALPTLRDGVPATAPAQMAMVGNAGGPSGAAPVLKPVVAQQSGNPAGVGPAALPQSQQVALVQADLQVPAAVQPGAQPATLTPRGAVASSDLPMAEFLLAHQQMAGGMMPVVPAVLRQPLAQAPASRP